MTPHPSRVLVRTSGRLGILTLNRPEAINALDLDMIRELAAALSAWQGDQGVAAVLLEGAGERGLCAGGDVRGLHGTLVAGRAEDAAVFFREEYALNALIAEYPKPVIALADGITMGGGIGLAGHAAIRVVTERSKLAMPETRIGFTPDVGGSWLLGRAPGRLGEYLGVTGAVMTAADAIHAGFADQLVPADRLDALKEALASDSDPGAAAVAAFAVRPAPSALAAERGWIDEVFAADDLSGVVRGLVAAGRADLIAGLSPTSMAVTLEAVRTARQLSGLRAALAQEFALTDWFAGHSDLAEGIRAQLVDKDRDPHWRPATVAELPEGVAREALAHRPARPLWA